MSEFDFLFKDKIELNSTENIQGKFLKNKNKQKGKLLKRFDELNKLFPNIEKNETIHLISSDNFGSIELLKVLISRYEFEYIGVTTWSYNQEFIEITKQILAKGIDFDFFVDKSMRTRKAHLYAQMITLMDEFKNLKIKIHHMLHSKITIIKAKNLYISIESSANYSNNQRIENYTITENEQVFNFHRKWMNEIIKK